MDFAAVNWTAVITGTIAAFIFGWLIYSPMLFGRKWAEGSHIELTSESAPPIFAMLAQIVALFLLALLIGLTETLEDIVSALISIFAVAAMVVANGSFGRKSTYARTVDGLGVVGAGAIMILAQGLL